jgi:flagellar biosynthesis/type III secretory pathway protein FliH
VCNKHERGHHAELMRAYEAGHQDGWTTGFEAGRRKGRLDLEWENVRDAARRKALGPALRPAVPTTGDDEL